MDFFKKGSDFLNKNKGSSSKPVQPAGTGAPVDGQQKQDYGDKGLSSSSSSFVLSAYTSPAPLLSITCHPAFSTTNQLHDEQPASQQSS